MNYLLHFTGLDSDFDAWEAAGANGWGAATMRKYLERMECRDGSPAEPATSWFGGKFNCVSEVVDQCSAAANAPEV